MAQADYDRLSQGLPHNEYLAACGQYQASKRAVELVDTLIEKVDALNAGKRDDDDTSRQHSRSIAYGSYLWR